MTKTARRRRRRALQSAREDIIASGAEVPASEAGRVLLTPTESIPSLDMLDIQLLVKAAKVPELTHWQYDIIQGALQKLLGSRGQPREQQIRAVRRIVYGWGDTILIAKTSFGKSLIIHSFSALAGMVTIQITPLTKLAEEQRASIRRYPFCKPCLVDVNTKRRDPGLLEDIRLCRYTHVLMGPEQLASDEFRALLEDGQFRNAIGMVAIDECHLVSEWEDFRSDYALIYELRRMLPSQVRWFGCTATMDGRTEERVKRFGGFDDTLEVIRTSVDRPEISICIVPIPSGKLGNFDTLYFLLAKASTSISGQEHGEETTPTPANIDKTVVFIDSVNQTRKLQNVMVDWLVQKGYSPQLARQTIQLYHSYLSDVDKDLIISEFQSEESAIRVLVSTSGMGTGMNISDVRNVIQWRFTIGDSILDTWQRFGRAVRKAGLHGFALLMVPYWVFDRLGVYPVGYVPSGRRPNARATMKKTLRNMTPADRARVRSSQQDPDEALGHDSSDMSDTSQSFRCSNSQDTMAGEQANRRGGKGHVWSAVDIRRRQKLPSQWSELCNSPCHREFFLAFLQEMDADPTTCQERPSKSTCCNGSMCNPDLFPGELIDPPPQDKVLTRPKRNTYAGIALEKIEARCADQAARESSEADDIEDSPSWAFMPRQMQCLVAYVFDEPYDTIANFRIRSTEQWGEDVGLEAWKHWSTHRDEVCAFLSSIVGPVRQEHIRLVAERRTKQINKKRAKKSMSEAQAKPGSNSQNPSDRPACSSQRAEDDARGLHIAVLQRQLMSQPCHPTPSARRTPSELPAPSPRSVQLHLCQEIRRLPGMIADLRCAPWIRQWPVKRLRCRQKCLRHPH